MYLPFLSLAGVLFFRLHSALFQIGNFRTVKIDPALWKLLYDNFRYFRHLDQKERYLFYLRCVAFTRRWKFLGRNGFLVRKQHEFLVAASFVKMTFGMSFPTMHIFDRILLFPQPYFSRITRQWHKGETNRNGLVVMSWEDYIRGVRVEDDNLHLGIHEFAHVLMIESEFLSDLGESNTFIHWLEKWKLAESAPEVSNFLNGLDYLRPYSRVNSFERFAVMVECFFETPHLFKVAMPGIYSHFVRMFEQDPDHIYSRPITPYNPYEI